MIISEQSFSGRLKQAFIIFIKNFDISIYYLLFAIISASVLSLFWGYIFFLASKSVNLKSVLWIDTSSYINMWYFWIIYSIISISVLILKIPFYISLVKNISDTYKWDNFQKNENLKFSFSRIWKIFNTYWYIFKYVALIPSLLLIFWLLIVFIDIKVWLIIVAFSIILFIYFAVFRWLRSFASLMYAIQYDDFSEDSFKKSIWITKYNVWTIFWNYVWIFIIFWFVTYIISKGFNIWVTKDDIFSSIITEIYNNKENSWITKEKLNALMEQITKAQSQSTLTQSQMIIGFLKKSFNSLIDSMLYVFWVIFYFLLMKKFENDQYDKNKNLETVN